MKVSEAMHAPAEWVVADAMISEIAARMAKDAIGDVAHATGLQLTGELARAVAEHHK